MWSATLKELLAHRVRLITTALAIALGVAFVGGTLVVSESLTSSSTEAVRHQYAGVDVTIRSAAPGAADVGRPAVPAGLVDDVRAVRGVAEVEGSVSGFALMVDADGQTIGAGAQSQNGMSAPASSTGVAVSYVSGRAPRGADEVAVDAGSAEQARLSVGDRIRVLFRGPPGEFIVVGVARFGDQDRLGSTTTALFDLETAQRVFGEQGAYDEIHVAGAEGTSAADLRDRIDAVLPSGIDVATGRAVADERAGALQDELSFFSTFLLVFASTAVFVGSFIIWNTFTILVAQRTREFALLRALGATRRQVRRAVLLEALVVGLLSSVAGLVLGFGLARLLVALLRSTGAEMPPPGLDDVSGRTVLVSLLVGTTITLLASLAPARRATLIAPVQALRESALSGSEQFGRRAAAGVLVLSLGAASLTAGAMTGAGLAVVGLGALGAFLGLTILLPLLSRALARVLGAPLPLLAGVPGRLARENAMRNPRRTASTAAALMVGLALVGSVTVLAQSLKATSSADVEGTLTADLVLQQADLNGLSPDLARVLRDVPGVAAVSELASARLEVGGAVTAVAPVDPTTVEQVVELGVVDGDVAALARGDVLVHDDLAAQHGWQTGDDVDVAWPSGRAALRIGGLFAHKGFVNADVLVALDAYDRHAPGRLDSLILLRTATDDVAPVQETVAEAVSAYAGTQVLTAEQLEQTVAGGVDQALDLMTVLLLLAVVIALLGIVNTLALSVLERAREIGLLRAVGMTRRQVRRMVRYESLVIAGIGSLTGTAVGVALGVALVSALEDRGVSELSVPWGRLGAYALVATATGVLAALGPAQRASRIGVMTAMKSD